MGIGMKTFIIGDSHVNALREAAGYTHGCAVADFDRDGFSDLFVTGYGCARLYRNDGRGRFVARRLNSQH